MGRTKLVYRNGVGANHSISYIVGSNQRLAGVLDMGGIRGATERTEMRQAGSSKTVIHKFPVGPLPEGDHVDHDLTLIIPAYNEESRLPKTLSDAKAYLDAWGINYRVLVVDDGSRDGTSKIASAFGRRFSTIRQENGGKGSAVRNGILAARGRVIGFTDADLPYDLDALKSAYATIDSGKREVVFGSRTAEGSSSQVERQWMRTVASFVFDSSVKSVVRKGSCHTGQ